MDVKLKKSKKHEGKFKNKKSELTFYTKKQMKEVYGEEKINPQYEIGNKGGKYLGSAKYSGENYQLFEAGSHNVVTEKVVGYVETEDKKMVAVVKNVLLKRILILLLCVTLPFVVVEDLRNQVIDLFKVLGLIKTEVGRPDLDPNAQKWQGKLPEEQDKPKTVGIQIPGYKVIRVKAGQTNQRVSLLNPEGNPCYFTISFVLADTGETIYKSKMVKPGDGLYNIKLTKKLKPGKYNMLLKYETNSLENLSKLNGANVNVTLEVI